MAWRSRSARVVNCGLPPSASGSPAKPSSAAPPGLLLQLRGQVAQVQDGPEESAQARSMEFSSSLTLPGQSCSIMVRNASSLKVNLVRARG